MKRMLLLLLMSGSAAVGMEKTLIENPSYEGTIIVSNRQTYTIENRRAALELVIQKLSEFDSEAYDEEIGLDQGRTAAKQQESDLPTSALEWSHFAAKVINVAKTFDFKGFFERLNSKVFLRLGEVDPVVYKPIYQFLDSMQGYFNRFSVCESDDQIAQLLKDIENDKEQIIGTLSLCAPVIVKIGQLCVNEVFRHCIADMPKEFKECLPMLWDQLKQVSSGFLSEGIDPMKGLTAILAGLSKGYLSNAIGMAELALSSQVQFPPQLRRSIFFAEGCAKIFLSNSITHKGRALLAYLPSEKQVFPLDDDYFKLTTFENLSVNAYSGELPIIKIFSERYVRLLKDCDKNGKNLLSFAILGYCAGKDEAWKVVAYLVDQDLEVTQSIRTILVTPSKDKDLKTREDRDSRKALVKSIIEKRDEFYKTKGNNFLMLCPEKPQALVVYQQTQNPSCIIS